MVATLDGYRNQVVPTFGSMRRLQLLKLENSGAARMESAQTTAIVLVALPAVAERVRRRSTSVGAFLVGGAGRALTTGRALNSFVDFGGEEEERIDKEESSFVTGLGGT
mmetsp:Transcript_9639/g.14710  ORF Transcript_9639/g.14710 Transcript_9639/m.14710 type:complete len:109 (-) Transcript_9639:58-384(-)